MKTLGSVLPFLMAKWAFEIFIRPLRWPRPVDELDFWQSGESLTLISGAKARKYGVGPCVWMVHGWEGRGSQFKDMALELVKAGFSVLLWEGPAHGDTPGKRTHLIQFSSWLEKDIRSQVETPRALIGHSFGGAASSIVAGRNIAIPYVVTIATPVDIFKIFTNYWERITLPARARKAFLKLVENETGVQVQEMNIAEIAKGYHHRFLVIHDENDKEVSFTNVERFQSIKTDAESLITKNLGHRRILRSKLVADRIIEFINS